MLGTLAVGLTACQVEPLALHEVSPSVLCVDAEVDLEVEIRGAGFSLTTTAAGAEPAQAELPEVELHYLGPLPGEEAQPDQTRVLAVDGSRLRWVGPHKLVLSAGPGLGVAPGLWELAVVNPDGERVVATEPLVLTGSPRFEAASPEAVCTDVDTEGMTLTLQGTGLVRLGEEGPAARLGGQELLLEELGGCEALGAAELCTEARYTVTGGVTLESLDLALKNPEPGTCGFTEEEVVEGVRAPSLESVSPTGICGDNGVITVTGERFEEGLQAWVGGVEVEEVTVEDAETLVLRLGEGTPTGLQDLEIAQPSGCTAYLAEAVSIRSSTDVFYLDPAALPEGVGVNATAWLADAGSPPTGVWLTDASGAELDVDFSWSEETPGSLRVSLPDTLAAGTYDLSLETEDGCGGSLETALTVQSELGLGVYHIRPAQAWRWDVTPVTIEGWGFDDLPRIFLTGPDGTGTVVQAVRYYDKNLVAAVIPAGLPVGTYTLIMVNPDLTVGRKIDGLEVVEEAPPEITSVRPLNLSASTDEVITIRGRDFRDPEVLLTCREDGVESEVSAVVQDWSYATIEALAPSSDFNAAVCVVDVVNDDGTEGRFASISVRNPSDNLFGWSVGTELITPRRAPAAVGGRTTSVTRHVYAIGGDAGSPEGALDTVERADIGVYGDLEAWTDTGRALPAPLTLSSAARVGRFVYLVGGHDGTGPVDSVWRALILDPLEVPRFASLSLDNVAGDGLDAGRWYYRVSAVYDETDLTNPGGESLAGDPIPVVVGAALAPARVGLSWEPVDDAVGYRIYRSPEADGGSRTMGWVADVDGDTSWQDTGLSADTSLVPLDQGDLGEWAELDPLPQPRAGACLADATDPAPDPERTHLLVAGGYDDDGTVLDSITRMTVTVASELEQSTTTWDTLPESLDTPRWACRAYVATDEAHTVVDDETWVWFAGGHGTSNVQGTVDAGQVLEGGSLDQWQTVDKLSPGRAGFGGAAASDQLYAFGGQKGEPSASGVSASIEEGAVPDLVNWNSLGDSMSEARYLPGTAVESGVMVIIGGETDTAGATTSVDWTPF